MVTTKYSITEKLNNHIKIASTYNTDYIVDTLYEAIMYNTRTSKNNKEKREALTMRTSIKHTFNVYHIVVFEVVDEKYADQIKESIRNDINHIFYLCKNKEHCLSALLQYIADVAFPNFLRYKEIDPFYIDDNSNNVIITEKEFITRLFTNIDRAKSISLEDSINILYNFMTNISRYSKSGDIEYLYTAYVDNTMYAVSNPHRYANFGTFKEKEGTSINKEYVKDNIVKVCEVLESKNLLSDFLEYFANDVVPDFLDNKNINLKNYNISDKEKELNK